MFVAFRRNNHWYNKIPAVAGVLKPHKLKDKKIQVTMKEWNQWWKFIDFIPCELWLFVYICFNIQAFKINF